MSKAKSKRKALQKIKRSKKKAQGKLAPFSLSNFTKPLKGISHKYEYKVNIHHCVFSNAYFYTVRYRSGHTTHSSFKKANIHNSDFICVNLKHNIFNATTLKDCIFFGCNFEGCNFKNSKIDNVYFIQCKFVDTKNFCPNDSSYFINKYPLINLSSELKATLHQMSAVSKLEKYKILTITSKKYNLWTLSILLHKFTEKEIVVFFKKLLFSNKTQFYTMHDYIFALQNYYKR